jgi:hypothetical protein
MDIEHFLKRNAAADLVRDAFVFKSTGLRERPPVAGQNYIATGVFSSSGVLLAFVVAHAEAGELFIDVAEEKPSQTEAVAMLKRYGVDVEHATSHASVGEDPLAWACTERFRDADSVNR